MFDADFGEDGFDYTSSVSYFESFTEYIANHFDRSSMLADVAGQLETAESCAIVMLKEQWTPVVRKWSSHFTLRDAQQSALSKNLSDPETDTFYVLADYQVAQAKCLLQL